MLITKEVVIKWHVNNKKHFEDKGYIFTKYKNEFVVRVEDLPDGSRAEIEVQCDYCERAPLKKEYGLYYRLHKNARIDKDCCVECSPKKVKEGNLLVYGIESTNQLPDIIRKKNEKKNFKQEFIREEFLKFDLILVGVYKRSNIPVEFICPIHEDKGVQTVRYSNLKTQEGGCPYCARERVANANRLSHEFVEEEFKKKRYTLLDTYISANTPMRYICSKHSDIIQTITYSSIQQGRGCPHCGREKAALSNISRHTYDFAVEEFKKRNYKLLTTEYKKMSTKMQYICERHPEHVQEVSLTNLLGGNGGCYYCGLEKHKGENNSNWQGGITPLLLFLRRTIYSWYFDSLKACNFKCIITGKPFEVVHHHHNFGDIVRETLKELKLPLLKNIGDYTKEQTELIEKKCLELHYKHGLGICLTKKLHQEFHKKYGKNKNNINQLNVFISEYKEKEKEVEK